MTDTELENTLDQLMEELVEISNDIAISADFETGIVEIALDSQDCKKLLKALKAARR
jgi:hypothetical protein